MHFLLFLFAQIVFSVGEDVSLPISLPDLGDKNETQESGVLSQTQPDNFSETELPSESSLKSELISESESAPESATQLASESATQLASESATQLASESASQAPTEEHSQSATEVLPIPPIVVPSSSEQETETISETEAVSDSVVVPVPPVVIQSETETVAFSETEAVNDSGVVPVPPVVIQSETETVAFSETEAVNDSGVVPVPPVVIQSETETVAFSETEAVNDSGVVPVPPVVVPTSEPTQTEPPTETPTETPTPQETPTPAQTPLATQSAPPTPERTPIPDLIPVIDHDCSNSTVFNITVNGFIEGEKDEKAIDKTQINRINFDQDEITISEAGVLESQVPLYFTAKKLNAHIKISDDVKKSNIGVTSDQSPIVELPRGDVPLSLMHNNTKGGTVTLNSPDGVTNLNLNGVTNKKGDLKILVSNGVSKISFKSMEMHFTSSISASHSESQQATLLADNDVEVSVQQNFTVASSGETEVLNKLTLDGTLYIDDKSQLKANSLTFGEASNIQLVLNDPQDKRTVIQVSDALNTVPSKVIISNPEEPIDVREIPVVSAKSFADWEKWKGIFAYPEGVEGQILVENKEVDGQSVIYLSAVQGSQHREPTKKKGLSGGAIAGIVIACVVVVAVIIGCIAYCVNKKNKERRRTERPKSLDEHLNLDI